MITEYAKYNGQLLSGGIWGIWMKFLLKCEVLGSVIKDIKSLQVEGGCIAIIQVSVTLSKHVSKNPSMKYV